MEKDEGVRAASSASPCCHTLITSDSPKYDPWQVVGTDLAELSASGELFFEVP